MQRHCERGDGRRGLIHHFAGLALAGVLAAPLGWTAASAATQDSFQPVGNLGQARDGARVTLLTDGTVLVTGGNHFVGSNGGPIAGAELFDPKINQFTAVGAMATPRDDSHSALRLKDGRVLIVGGSPDYKTQVREAEVYDPSTRAFAPAGNLVEARSSHTTTLLLNGQVLVAGGWNSDEGGPTATAELFDPASGRFEKTARMAVARYRHAAVLLPDGRVVILGGYDPGNQGSRSVEIYDPKTATFTAAGELVVGRGDLSATLLPDGRILVAGGGYPGQGAKNEVEIYDPATGLSAVTDALTDARVLPIMAATPDGRILIAGGYGKLPGMAPVPLRTTEVADLTTGKLTPTTPMTVPRASPSGVALLDGRVLILGGFAADGSSLNTAEVFVPGTASTSPQQ